MRVLGVILCDFIALDTGVFQEVDKEDNGIEVSKDNNEQDVDESDFEIKIDSLEYLNNAFILDNVNHHVDTQIVTLKEHDGHYQIHKVIQVLPVQ